MSKERDIFKKALLEWNARGTGKDLKVRCRTTAQRRNTEDAVTSILRDGIEWGTPIVFENGVFTSEGA